MKPKKQKWEDDWLKICKMTQKLLMELLNFGAKYEKKPQWKSIKKITK